MLEIMALILDNMIYLTVGYSSLISKEKTNLL
jgi:hypothetical protein